MTIVAGFKCIDGIVLCSDTLETVAGISKRHIPKLRFEPTTIFGDRFQQDDGMAVAFCGSTDNGPFLDELIDDAWNEVRGKGTLEDACSCIKNRIEQHYQKFGQIYQPGFCPSTELIYGVKVGGESRLFYSLGPAVNEQDTYAAGGAGRFMATFLMDRMGRDGLLPLRQIVILAAYVLFQAKEHVDGCGGDSHIAVLRNNGVSGMLDSNIIRSFEDVVTSVDSYLSSLIIDSADLDQSWANIEKYLKSISKSLSDVRQKEEDKRKSWNEFWGLDNIGLPSGEPRPEE